MATSVNAVPFKSITWAAMPRNLQWMIVALAAIAVAILWWSGRELMIDMPDDHGWMTLAVLGILTFPFFVYLPRIESVVLIGETYFMAIALLYGPAACVISSAIYGLLTCLILKSFKPSLFVYGFSVVVCDAFLYSMVFQIFRPANANDIRACLLPAAMMAIVTFLFTSLNTALAVSWRHGKQISAFWIRAYLPLLLNSFIAAGAAVCISVFINVHPYMPLAAAPAVGIIWWWTKSHAARLGRIVEG